MDAHGEKRQEPLPASVMLLNKLLHGPVEERHLVQRTAPSALALVMNDGRRVDISHPPTGLPDTIAPVEIFAIHEEPFVQPPHTFDRFTSNEHKRTAHGIHIIRLVGTPVGQIVASKNGAGGKEPAESKDAGRGHPRRWETPASGQLEGPVRIEDLATCDAHVWMIFEVGPHHSDRVFLYDGVRVQQENISAAGNA